LTAIQPFRRIAAQTQSEPLRAEVNSEEVQSDEGPNDKMNRYCHGKPVWLNSSATAQCVLHNREAQQTLGARQDVCQLTSKGRRGEGHRFSFRSRYSRGRIFCPKKRSPATIETGSSASSKQASRKT